MANYTPADIRNVAIVGGAGTGKTTLIEALLFRAGVIQRRGNVADGTSFVDYDADEREKRHTLYMKVFDFSEEKHQFNLFDTPGYPDYVGEVLQALASVEIGLVCVNAETKVNFHVHRIWNEVVKAGRGRAIVVTHADGEHANSTAVVEAIRDAFGETCVPVNMPNENGPSITGVIDLLDGSDLSPEASAMHNWLVETLVTLDEGIMEHYLETGEVTHQELIELLSTGIATNHLTPILFTAAPKDVGLTELVHFLAEYAPSPLQGPFFDLEDGSVLDPNKHSEFTAKVFKTISDPFVGRLSYLRVVSGEVKTDQLYLNMRTGKTEKMGHILRLKGKEQEAVDHALAGDIVAVAKAETLETGDSLTVERHEVHFRKLEVPPPMVSFAISPKNRNDEQKMSTSLRKMLAEDPTLFLEREPQTAELILSGVSELHVNTALNHMKKRFKVEVDTKIPRVPLRETISVTAEGHHRHKKQSGGRGQFGEVFLRVSPTERGAGFSFSDDTFGGSVPRQYVPAVEKGALEQVAKGVVAGHPVVDIKVSVYDGKHHDVDSDEASFKVAGARAFRDAFEKAKPVLLEPIVKLEVAIPARFMGDINSDLNSRRGRIHGMNVTGDMQVIEAEIPLKEVQTYAADLRSLTQGEGSFVYKFSHYDVVPANVANDIMKAYKAGLKPDED